MEEKTKILEDRKDKKNKAESALKEIKDSNIELLDRIRNWEEEKDLYEEKKNILNQQIVEQKNHIETLKAQKEILQKKKKGWCG